MNFKEIASTMTNGEIVDAIKILHEEQQRRKKALKARHQKFIDEFYNVFPELQDEEEDDAEWEEENANEEYGCNRCDIYPYGDECTEAHLLSNEGE